jgi:hypothetical protein
MLDKCKRSCNLCGDLVQQKDRIKFTSKKVSVRRPFISNQFSSITVTSKTTSKCLKKGIIMLDF